MTRAMSRMSATDAGFIYAEKPEAPMHIGAAALVEGEIPFDAFVADLDARVSRLPRFMQRMVPSPLNIGHPTWEPDPGFDIERHVFLHHAEGEDDVAEELSRTASAILSPMLARDKPLWEFHIIHGLGGGMSALVSKVHHAMVDGVGANEIVSAVFSLDPDGDPPEKVLREDFTPPDAMQRLVDSAMSVAQSNVENWAKLNSSWLERFGGGGRERVQTSMQALFETMPDLALPLRRLPFNKRCSTQRKLTWVEFSFAEARAIRRLLSGTVNDVILTIIGGAAAKYARLHGENVKGRTMRVMVPVNVRPESETSSLGNLVSIMPVSVPLDIDDPGRRLRSIRATTRLLKSAHVADNVSLLSAWAAMVPPAMQAAMGRFAPQGIPVFNTVITNVPGPQVPIYVQGLPVMGYYPFVPVGYDMGLGFAIYSYNQRLFIGLTADVQACPDVDAMRDFIIESITELKQAAGVEDVEFIDTAKRRRPRPASPEPESRAKAPGGRPAKRAKSASRRGKSSARSTARGKKST